MSGEVTTTFVRRQGPAGHGRIFGPYDGDSDNTCMGCGKRICQGDFTVLVPLGPGADPEARRKCASNGFYNSVCIEVHYPCATGREPEFPEEPAGKPR